MTIVELREKRAKLWATMEGFLDTHRDRKGVLSAEDDAVYANMEKELNDLTNEVRRMERRDAIAAELAKPVSSPITEQPQKATGEAKTGRASNAYREDFGLHLRGKRIPLGEPTAARPARPCRYPAPMWIPRQPLWSLWHFKEVVR